MAYGTGHIQMPVGPPSMKAGRSAIIIASALALGGGLVLTALVATLAAAYSSGPSAWHVSNSDMPESPAISAWSTLGVDPGLCMVNTGLGFGYRARDIRTYQRELPIEAAVGHSDVGPPLSRCFITELGWPNLCVRTTSRDIGLPFAEPSFSLIHGDVGCVNMQAKGGVIWTGFAFNTLAFGLPLFAGYFVFRRARTSDWLAPATISLALGFWLVVALAWALCLLPISRNVTNLGPSGMTSVEHVREPAGDAWALSGGKIEASLGYRAVYAVYIYAGGDSSQTTAQGVMVPRSFAVGLPFPCLATSDRPPFRRSSHFVHAVFQLPPYWPGLIADWMIGSALLMGIVTVPGVVRARSRRRRGLCAACGYPKGATGICSECGASIDAGSEEREGQKTITP